MCLSAPVRRGPVSSTGSPSQNRKKASLTPRTFTFETRVCLSGATTVPFNRIACTIFSRRSNVGAKNRAAVSAYCIVPRRSNVTVLRLPRTESPTSNAPANTPVATAVQSDTVRWMCQKCFKFFSILSLLCQLKVRRRCPRRVSGDAENERQIQGCA